MHSFMFCLFSLPTFIAAFIAYYLYDQYYKRCKEARQLLLYKKQLQLLQKYFHGHTICCNKSKLQGKKNNFYDIKEYDDFFDCTLYETRNHITIYRDSTFDDVSKGISEIIYDIDLRLDTILLTQLYR